MGSFFDNQKKRLKESSGFSFFNNFFLQNTSNTDGDTISSTNKSTNNDEGTEIEIDNVDEKKKPKTSMDRYDESQKRRRAKKEESDLNDEVEAFIRKQEELDEELNPKSRPKASMDRYDESQKRKLNREANVLDEPEITMTTLKDQVERLESEGRLIPSPPSGGGLYRLETSDGELSWVSV